MRNNQQFLNSVKNGFGDNTLVYFNTKGIDFNLKSTQGFYGELAFEIDFELSMITFSLRNKDHLNPSIIGEFPLGTEKQTIDLIRDVYFRLNDKKIGLIRKLKLELISMMEKDLKELRFRKVA